MKTCYYELLGVQSTSDDAELKKAFRRKALQYHPDKNIDNVEEATDAFAQIRAAYEVLSDPQERAWYDSHKHQILNEDLNGGQYEEEDNFTMDGLVTGVTTEEVLMFFNSSLYTRVDDTPAGLYQIAGKVFSRLAKDEVMHGRMQGLKQFNIYADDYFEAKIGDDGYVKACDARIKECLADNSRCLFPPFGYSLTDYELLKEFYKKWSCFSTAKSFRWKDEYMYSSVYDRRTKREINKRNDKARQQAKNEYNKTVKQFVGFVKKLDPRMREGDKRAKELKREKERQKFQELRNVAKKSEPEFEMQGWQTINEDKWKDLDKLYGDPSGGSDEDGSQSDVEVMIYDCFVCNKKFKSENQLENHSTTRAHRKNVSKMQRQMKKENVTLGLDELSDLDDYASAASAESAGGEITGANAKSDYSSSGDVNIKSTADDGAIDDDETKKLEEELAQIESQLAGMESDYDTKEIPVEEELETEIDVQVINSEPEYLPLEEDRDQELEKLLDSLGKGGDQSKSNNGHQSTNPTKPAPKEICSTCNQGFPSRNKLFSHVNNTGHAAPPSKAKSKGNKKRKHKKAK